MSPTQISSEAATDEANQAKHLNILHQLSDLDLIYSNNGDLAVGIPGFIYRENQLLLAKKIYLTFKHKKILLAEAGTGTGKTLSYLIPALYSNKQTIISTGTKNLQNQLFFRDLPAVIKAINLPVKTALLKGRANYLCKYRLEQSLTDFFLSSAESVMQFKQIVSWSQATDSGDISTLADIPEDAEVWRSVTSTADSCLGNDCPFINNCFVYKARQIAMDAKIVVINHHLLLSDWNLKASNSEAKLLPNGVNLVLDEAHQLAEIASFHFGTVLSSKKIRDLTQDILVEQQLYAKDVKAFSNITTGIARLLDQTLQNISQKPERGIYQLLQKEDNFKLNLSNLGDLFKELNILLSINSERSKGLKSCYERCLQLQDDLAIFIDNKDNQHKLKWYEIYKLNFMLKESPLDISHVFYSKLIEASNSAVLTSATMSVVGDFSLIQRDLGLSAADTIKIESPFNYKQQALLYIPRCMPDPMANNYIDCYLEQVLPILESSKGRAFLLFTSFNHMHIVYERLKETVSPVAKYNILLQGKASKSALLERFITGKNSILLATASFWEGIDVRGADLHCVIIDKLPFTSPTEPILQAKVKLMREQGRDPFKELQCQQAVLQLTQGAGRLIRSEQDYGVLMICDPRIIGRSYGELFLKSLPPMKRTRELNLVKEFYEQREQKSSI